MKTKKLLYWVVAFMVPLGTMCAAELSFSKVFTDHMVLQRNKSTVVRGSAEPGKSVTLSIATQTHTGVANEMGQWEISLDPMPVNKKGLELVAKSGGQEIILRDVLVGEVILFGRQTSIDISLGRDAKGKKAAEALKKSPLLRVLSLKNVPSTSPLDDLPKESTTGGWKAMDSQATLGMSLAAFYLGQDLAQDHDMPLGLIDLNMGYHFIAGWLKPDVVYEEKIEPEEAPKPEKEEKKKKKKKKKVEEPKPVKPPEPPENDPLFQGAGYNSILHPMRGFGIGSVLLQLGNDYSYLENAKLERLGTYPSREELDEAYQKEYMIRKDGFRQFPNKLPLVPEQWRKVFGDSGLPLAFIAPPASDLESLASHAREVRELQRRIAASTPGVDVVMPGMENLPFSAQPKDEQLLAERCALWVKAQALEKKEVVFSGPVFQKIDVDGKVAKVYFEEGTARGLHARGDSEALFEVAEEEGEYVPAKMKIVGEVVHLTSEKPMTISRVRYNWAYHPKPGLLNGSGLPALSFISGNHHFLTHYVYDDEDLREEYSLPASQWKNSHVTLFSGGQSKKAYREFSGFLGPIGTLVGPLGVNMIVREVEPGSPAEGLLRKDDVIFSANGKELGNFPPSVISAAITESETELLGGKLSLGVRRDQEVLNIQLQLKELGRYSETAPWDCPKTDSIVAGVEEYIGEEGMGSNFLNVDMLFMLGAGTPKYEAWLRKKMAWMKDIEGWPNNWFNGYNAIFLGEYYLATGDKSVLPALKRVCDTIADHQIKNPEAGRRVGDWFGVGKQDRKYPAMPAAGLACLLGLQLAREAGLEIDEAAYQRGLAYFRTKGAAAGIIIYGDAYRDKPVEFEPEAMEKGTMSTDNGKVAAAAVLFDLAGDKDIAKLCSKVSRYSFFSTYGGHGGNFWNNVWTPVGAAVNGKQSLVDFMKGHRWYWELNRRYDKGLIVDQGRRAGGATALALVAPRQNLRILGAPLSPFGTQRPAGLEPALASYWAKDYKKSRKLAQEFLASGKVEPHQRPTVERLIKIIDRVEGAVEVELGNVHDHLEKKDVDLASDAFVALQGFLDESDPRLVPLKSKINITAKAGFDGPGDAMADKDGGESDKATMRRAQTELKKKRFEEMQVDLTYWNSFITSEFANDKSSLEKGADGLFWQFGHVDKEQASVWRLKVLENFSQAPSGWSLPEFDDTSWKETTLPTSWRINHTSLLRTKFEVDDPSLYEKLRFRGWFFRQQNVKFFLNGHFVGVLNGTKSSDHVSGEFKDSVLKFLKKGTNTFALTTRHNWRWGKMRLRVYNNGMSLMLDGRLKEKKGESQ